jgi:hypothetical protein
MGKKAKIKVENTSILPQKIKIILPHKLNKKTHSGRPKGVQKSPKKRK